MYTGRFLCQKIVNSNFRIIITSATLSIELQDNGTEVNRFLSYFDIKPKVLSLENINGKHSEINLKDGNRVEEKKLF